MGAMLGFAALGFLSFDQIVYYGTLVEMGLLALFVAWCALVVVLVGGRRLLRSKP